MNAQRPWMDGTSTGPVRQWVHGVSEFITSNPIPLHTARINRTSGGEFVVRMVSLVFDPVVGRYPTREQAREGASRAVNTRTAHDMRSVYSGPQRYAMGQQQCPRRIGTKLCLSPAMGYSVWCDFHPKGGERDV